VFAVEFNPALQVLSFLGFFGGDAVFLTQPTEHFLLFEFVQFVEVEPLCEDFAIFRGICGFFFLSCF
jgi:hypothetical protein